MLPPDMERICRQFYSFFSWARTQLGMDSFPPDFVDLNTTNTELCEGMEFLESDPENASLRIGAWLELDSVSEDEKGLSESFKAETPVLSEEWAGSPIFKNRSYVLNSDSIEEPIQFYETEAFQTLQNQIEAVMNQSDHSSESMSEKLCPLLLAQNAHLQSLLRNQQAAGSSSYEKHLDLAASGIREQSQVLEHLKHTNESLKEEREDAKARLLAFHEEMAGNSAEHSNASLLDLIELLYEKKKERNEMIPTSDIPEEQRAKIEAVLPKTIPCDAEEPYITAENIEDIRMQSFLEKSKEWIENNEYQSNRLQNLLELSNQLYKPLSALADEFHEIMEQKRKYTSINDEIKEFKPAQEELRELTERSVYIQEQLSEMVASHQTFRWFGNASLQLENIQAERKNHTERIQWLLGENASLLDYSMVLVSECDHSLRTISALQREISVLRRKMPLAVARGEQMEEIDSLLDKMHSVHDEDSYEGVGGQRMENSDWFATAVCNDRINSDYEETISELRRKTEELAYWKESAQKTAQSCSEDSSLVLPPVPSCTIENDGNDVFLSYQEEVDTLSSIVEGLTEEKEKWQKDKETLHCQLVEVQEELERVEIVLGKQKRMTQQMTKKMAKMKVAGSCDLLAQKTAVIQQLSQQRDELGQEVRMLKQKYEALQEENQRQEDSMKMLKVQQSSEMRRSPCGPLSLDSTFDDALRDMEKENSLLDVNLLRSRLLETLEQNKSLMDRLRLSSDPPSDPPF